VTVVNTLESTAGIKNDTLRRDVGGAVVVLALTRNVRPVEDTTTSPEL
jgi:hypothetical protein